MKLDRNTLLWLILLTVLSSTWNICYFTATTHLAIGTVSGSFNGMTLVMTGMVSLVVLQNCSKPLAAAVVLCITGMILLAQPEFMFGKQKTIYKPICKLECTNQTGNEYLSTVDPVNKTINEETTTTTFREDIDISVKNSTTLHSVASSHSGITGYSWLCSASFATTAILYVGHKRLHDVHFAILSLFTSGFGNLVCGWDRYLRVR